MSLSDSSPVYFVQIQPEGKGENFRVDTTDEVTSFEFEDDEKKADKLTLEVDNFDLSNFDNPVWKPGNKLIVTWGYPGHMAPSRECIIQKVTGSTKLKIEALSKAILMNKDIKNRTFENTTRGDVVRGIAYDHGYEFNHQDIEDTETVYEHITQARMSDAQFIKKLADAEHFEFYVDFDGIHWHSRRLGQKPLRVLQYYLPPDVGDIISFDVENNIFAKPAKVVAKSRDPLKKTTGEGEASDSKTERTALQPKTELIDPATGEITFQKNVASSETRPTTETDAKQVKKEADGAFKRAALTAVQLTVEMVGDPGICAKSVIEVRGISKRLSGLYYVKTAKHKIDSGGYKLSLKCQTDGTHGHSENLLNEGTATKKKPASKATPNDQKGGASDPNASTKIERVNPTDGTSYTEYHPDAKDPTKK